MKAFIRFHGLRHPAEMGGSEVEAFPTHVADDRSGAPSTHGQTLSALLFFCTKVPRPGTSLRIVSEAESALG